MEQQHDTQLGPVTQDDPIAGGLGMIPDTGSEGDMTFVAVFEDATGARSCAEDLERRHLGVEVGMVARRGDGPEQGLSPGNVITGPGYGESHEGHSPKNEENHMGQGVAVGATLGATTGLLAATYIIPGLGTLVATGSLISTLVGAGLGSFLGGLVEYAAADEQDDATIYAGTVRRGGVLLLVRTSQRQADEVKRLIQFWNPLEIRVQ